MANYEIIIEAGRAERHYWLDLWRFRELFYILAWRDILVRYKQTVVGALWALLRPLLTMLVFVIVFGRIARLPSEGIPYPIFVIAAMLPWYFFASSFSEAGNSLVDNSNLISKVYFPRLIIPFSSIMVSLVDFLISFAILLGLLVWYQFLPGWQIVAIIPLMVLAFMASFGAGLWTSALNVKYRDFRYIVPFVVQFGLYISPVGFSSSVITGNWRLLYSLNPMTGVIDGFRWALTGGRTSLYLPGMAVSFCIIAILCVSGIWYFRKTERSFADVI